MQLISRWESKEKGLEDFFISTLCNHGYIDSVFLYKNINVETKLT
jgi:hypothetical protein